MQKKLIATALGAFGFGALVSWAVTSDIREKQLLDERKQYEEMIHYKTQHIWALQDRLGKLDGNPFGVMTVTSVDGMKTEGYTITDNDGSVITWNPIRPGAPGKLIVTATGTVIPKEEDQEQFEFEEEDAEEDLEVQEGETVEETRSNLQSIIDSYVGNPEEQDIMNDIISNSIEDDNSPPFVISQATYAWDEEGESYEKISLSYFPRDRVLLDDEEEPIEDVNRTVGWRNLTQFGGESGDADVVFVRNHPFKTDFEVIKDDDSQLPLHVKYGMEKEEFRANKAAGLIRLRQEDDDH